MPQGFRWGGVCNHFPSSLHLPHLGVRGSQCPFCQEDKDLGGDGASGGEVCVTAVCLSVGKATLCRPETQETEDSVHRGFEIRASCHLHTSETNQRVKASPGQWPGGDLARMDVLGTEEHLW